VLQRYFQVSATAMVTEAKFGEDFTALNLSKFAGNRIRWTNNLANHLRLMDNDAALCIFHHVCFLKHQDRCGTASILPPGHAEETLRTIAMLFPTTEAPTTG
jgi:hypothetical protein